MFGRHLVGTLGSSWVELARLVPTGPLVPSGAVVIGAAIWTSLEPGESTYQNIRWIRISGFGANYMRTHHGLNFFERNFPASGTPPKPENLRFWEPPKLVSSTSYGQGRRWVLRIYLLAM